MAPLNKDPQGLGAGDLKQRDRHSYPHRSQGVRAMGETPGQCLSATHLLSLGSSITSEARKPWGSLWGDRKSLALERWDQVLSTPTSHFLQGFSPMTTAPGHPPSPVLSLTTGPGGPAWPVAPGRPC